MANSPIASSLMERPRPFSPPLAGVGREGAGHEKRRPVLHRDETPFNRRRLGVTLCTMTLGSTAETFESALKARAEAMADACTRCGKCVEVCPATAAAGLSAAERQNPVHVIDGIIDIVRHGEGNEAARKWASGCLLSGECIKACDYGVNPRFLLAMARVAMVRAENQLSDRRRRGVQDFRTLNKDVAVLSQMQLTADMLQRLGQAAPREDTDRPDFVFYT